MKLTLGEIANAESGIVELSKCLLPARSAFKVSRILREISAELEGFHKHKNELVKKLGESTDGESYKIKPENAKEFTKQIEDLLKEEIELKIEPLKLEHIEGAKISTMAIVSLGKLVTE